LDILQELVPCIKTKKTVPINTCLKMSGFEFKWMITFNSTLTVKYFTYNWHNIFAVHIPNLITVQLLLFIKSQVKTIIQSALHLNHCTHGHAWLLAVTSFQWSWGSCKWLDKHKKCTEVSLFSIGVKYTRGIKCTHR